MALKVLLVRGGRMWRRRRSCNEGQLTFGFCSQDVICDYTLLQVLIFGAVARGQECSVLQCFVVA